MSDLKALLEKRKEIRRKRPSFMRKDIYKKGRIGTSWRKPRGLDNKQRLCKKGAHRKISIGFRAPQEVRGCHKSGLMPVVVSNVAQLNALTKEQGVVISSMVGNRKRAIIITEVKKKGLVLLNLDAGKAVEKIQSELKQRQEQKKKKLLEQTEKKKSIEEKIKKQEAKQETKPEVKQAAETKEAGEEGSLSDEEKKKQEKQEKDRLLTKRE
jgi:large subunit ribosomal protein L32e